MPFEGLFYIKQVLVFLMGIFNLEYDRAVYRWHVWGKIISSFLWEAGELNPDESEDDF